MTATPGRFVTIPPGGVEGVGGFWVHWFDFDNENVSLGAEFYCFFTITFDPTSDWPVQNFEPSFNLHVTPSNPAWSGQAISPIQVDFSAQTVKVYTHGAGTFDPNTYGPGVPGYHNVIQTMPGTPTSSIALPVSRGIRYDVSVHGILSPDPAVGFVECYLGPRDGSVSEPIKLCSHHCPTFYNNDPGPLALYYGFYTRGEPGNNPQPRNDAATFKFTAYMPRMGGTIQAALAHTPVITNERGANDVDPSISVVATPATLDGSDFMYPTPWNVVPPPPPGGTTTPIPTGTSQFGYATKGSVSISGTGQNFIFGSHFPIGEDGILTGISAYMTGRGVNNQVFRPAIYSDSAGSPNSLLAVGNEFIVAPTDDGWRSLPIFAGAASTFGKTAIGATTYLDQPVDIEVQGPYTIASNGSLTKLTARIGGSATNPDARVRLIIYKDLAGVPGSLVAVTAEQTILASSAISSVDFPLLSALPINSGDKYWIGFWTNGNLKIVGDASAPGSTFNLSQAYSSTANPPDPWTNAGTGGSSGQEYTLFGTFGPTVSLVSGSTYWLCLWSGPTDRGANTVWDTGAASAGFFCPVTYASTGNPASIAGFTYQNAINSIYATYTAVTPIAPSNSVLPTITGSAVVGAVLTGSDGTWSGGPSFGYQWQRNNVNIAGATSKTYTVLASDQGTSIFFVVTATNTMSSVHATSAPLAIPAAPLIPINTSPPTISGVLQVGAVLTLLSPGVWTNMETGNFTYQWQRNGADVAGQTGATYTLTVADLNAVIRIGVTAHNSATT